MKAGLDCFISVRSGFGIDESGECCVELNEGLRLFRGCLGIKDLDLAVDFDFKLILLAGHCTMHGYRCSANVCFCKKICFWMRDRKSSCRSNCYEMPVQCGAEVCLCKEIGSLLAETGSQVIMFSSFENDEVSV